MSAVLTIGGATINRVTTRTTLIRCRPYAKVDPTGNIRFLDPRTFADDIALVMDGSDPRVGRPAITADWSGCYTACEVRGNSLVVPVTLVTDHRFLHASQRDPAEPHFPPPDQAGRLGSRRWRVGSLQPRHHKPGNDAQARRLPSGVPVRLGPTLSSTGSKWTAKRSKRKAEEPTGS